jgi:dynein heavy chain
MSAETPVVKGWVVYRNIEEMIKNMNIILPLINALHADSMRDRHWKSVATVCGVKSVDPYDPKFTFEDIIKLKVNEKLKILKKLLSYHSKSSRLNVNLRILKASGVICVWIIHLIMIVK